MARNSTDRIDSNGNYCKENCRWASRKRQSRNRDYARLIEFNGVKKCIGEWAEIIGLKYHTLYDRFYKGWSVERALTEGTKLTAIGG